MSLNTAGQFGEKPYVFLDMESMGGAWEGVGWEPVGWGVISSLTELRKCTFG